MLTIMVSCEKRNSLEEILIAKPNEAWVSYNPEPYASYFTYDKFGKDYFSNRFERDSSNKFYKYKGADDNPEMPRSWSVTNDSILKWGARAYDVVSYNEDIIVLYYTSDNNYRNDRMLFLIKEKENHPRKYSNYFSQKRVDHPEKYIIP
jgi:hypothetical protein